MEKSNLFTVGDVSTDIVFFENFPSLFSGDDKIYRKPSLNPGMRKINFRIGKCHPRFIPKSTKN